MGILPRIMKLSTIFVIAASLAEAKKKKPKTAASDAAKLKRNFEFVWDNWYYGCTSKHGDEDYPRSKRFGRFIVLVDKAFETASKCGGPVTQSRRRRDNEDEEEDVPQTHQERAEEFQQTFEENPLQTDGDEKDERVNKVNRKIAVKQIRNILRRYADSWIVNCEDAAPPKIGQAKLQDRADRWMKVLNENSGCKSEIPNPNL